MFANQRRGSAGLGSIAAVALVMATWFVGTGVLVQVYRHGGVTLMPSGGTCQVVCHPGQAKG